MLAYFELSWVHNIQTGKSGKSACLFPDQFKLVLKTTLCSEWKLFCISIDNQICLCKMRQKSIHSYKLCKLLLLSTSSANSYLTCSFSFIWQPQLFFPPSFSSSLPFSSPIISLHSSLKISFLALSIQFGLVCKYCIPQNLFHPCFCYSARNHRVSLKYLLRRKYVSYKENPFMVSPK